MVPNKKTAFDWLSKVQKMALKKGAKSVSDDKRATGVH